MSYTNQHCLRRLQGRHVGWMLPSRAQLHATRVWLLNIGSTQNSDSSHAAGQYRPTEERRVTCREGSAVQLAQDAEVAQRGAAVPGGLAHGPVHVHIGQVHHAGRHDLVCGCLHAMASASAVFCMARALGAPTGNSIMPCMLLAVHGSKRQRGLSAWWFKTCDCSESCARSYRDCALQHLCTTAKHWQRHVSIHECRHIGEHGR